MPIPREEIPGLIKKSEEKRVEQWKRDYFEKVCKNLQVHTKGQLFEKVDSLFPNEHPTSKDHAIKTYEPITKGSIWKAINNINRIFSNSSFSITVSDELTKFLSDYEWKGQNLLDIYLEMWINFSLAEDPNGLFVVYPIEYAEERNICPLQFVRSELIRSWTKKQISFVSEIDSSVAYYYETVAQKREVYYDAKVEGLNARTCTQTTYNQRLRVKIEKEVVHLFTLDGFIIYQSTGGNSFDWTVYQFPQTHSVLAVFPGGGMIVDKADTPIFDSFVSPFNPFGNLALLQHRNHRAVDLMFSYPRLGELETPCDKCEGGKIKGKKTTRNPNGISDCGVCNGSGFVTVQSPYKTYRRKYDPQDAGDNKHLNTPPVEFYSPDTGIINYSKESWKDYLELAEQAVFVQQKVKTGNVESADSKNLDQEEMFSWLINISKVFYSGMRIFLQSLEAYVNDSETTVSVEKPYSFAVLTEGEAFAELNAILTSEAPIFVKGNRVDNFLSKFVSKGSPIIKAVNVLKKYDPLLFYSLKEIQAFKSSNTITADMWTKHILAYPELMRLWQFDNNLFEKPDEQIMTALDASIASHNIPKPGDGLKTAIGSQL